MSSNKAVIYIDTEDDITSVIDKTTTSKGGIIALVLPKRYSTLKSSVNMKLLKKTAENAKKKIVLITNDDALLPLAGNAGIHVAESLKSRPAVPKYDKPGKDTSPVIEDSDPDLDPKTSPKESKGGKNKSKDSETHSGGTAASDKSEKIKKIKGLGKIKVPNFGRFRLKMVLSVLAVIGLGVGWYMAFKVAPKAHVTIEAQTSRVATEVRFWVNPNLKENDIATKKIVGEVQEISKTVTERFESTGEKDVGAKATGVMTVQNCDSSQSLSLPAGTIFTDNTNGFDYTSDSTASVPGGSFSGGGCDTPGEVDVTVTAVDSGDTRNLSPRGYSVSGVSGFVTGFGGSMSGGTSKIVKVVSAEDITKAKRLLLSKTDDKIKSELTTLFAADTVIIDGTFKTANTTAVTSVKVGGEATEASVSAQFTYSIIGISSEDMGAILEQHQATLVDIEAQSILDNGVSTVKLEVIEELKDSVYKIEANTNGFVGPELNTEELAIEIAGMKFSEAVSHIKSKAGVREVTLELTPFWVFSVPSPEKTTIEVIISEDPLQ